MKQIKKKLLGELGSLIVSLKISYKNSSTFCCNLGFVNNFCNENSNAWVSHAFCNIFWTSGNLEHRKKNVFYSLILIATESTYRGVTHTVPSKRRLLNRLRPTATEWYRFGQIFFSVSFCWFRVTMKTCLIYQNFNKTQKWHIIEHHEDLGYILSVHSMI